MRVLYRAFCLFLVCAIASFSAWEDGENKSTQESGATITSGQVDKLNALDAYTGSNNQWTAAQEIVGFTGISNAQAPAGTVHNLFVQASTNGAINHAIAVHCGNMSDSNSVGALHIYANTNGPGSAIHIGRLGKSATGGGLMRLEDNAGTDIITVDADAGEVKVIGQFVAQEGTGSGVTPNAAADSFIVDSSELNAGITITSTNGGNASILFGTLGKGNNAASFQYISSIDRLRFKVANVTKAEILAGSVDIGTNLNVAAALDVDGAADFAQRPTVGTQEVAYVSQLGGGGGGSGSGAFTNYFYSLYSPQLNMTKGTAYAFGTTTNLSPGIWLIQGVITELSQVNSNGEWVENNDILLDGNYYGLSGSPLVSGGFVKDANIKSRGSGTSKDSIFTPWARIVINTLTNTVYHRFQLRNDATGDSDTDMSGGYLIGIKVGE